MSGTAPPPVSTGNPTGTGGPIPPNSAGETSATAMNSANGPGPGQGARSPPTPAAPPSKIEIERKLSFKSAARPRPGDSPKKSKKPQAPPSSYPMSGNDSDTSTVSHTSTQQQLTSPAYPSSPLLTPSVGLSSIAEREKRSKASAIGSGEDFDVGELEDVEEEGAEDGLDDEGEGEESDDVAEGAAGDLQRGMEGERMVKSGFLYKKQERRKAWKKKWFVLRTGKLAYYKDEKEYSLRRVLDLKSIHTVAPVTVKKHPFTFGIVTSKRTFFAKALSQDEMDDWVRTINSARRRLSEREEEKSRRPGGSVPVAMPNRPDRKTSVDEYAINQQLITPGTSLTASPIATTSGSHFPQPGSPVQPGSSVPIHGSLPDSNYSLTSQMAKMSLPTPVSPTTQAGPRLPSARMVSGASTRRDPSASSYSSSAAMPTDYFGAAGVNATLSSAGSTWTQQPQPSSDEEGSFSDHQSLAHSTASVGVGSSMSAQPSQTQSLNVQTQTQAQPPAVVDPKKIILQAYLMKRSKGRGRKVWRKRWFYLTSQGLTYTKSHMDSRALRFVPLTSILDALELNPDEEALSDGTDSDGDSGYQSPVPVTRQFTNSRRNRRDDSARTDKPGMGDNEHLFRLITAKRTFVLCAPSEEDEIKWLAAFRALLNRQREGQKFASSGSPSASPTLETAPGRFAQAQLSVPMITQQPPTPAAQAPGLGPAAAPGSGVDRIAGLGQPSVVNAGGYDGVPPTPAVNTSQGPPVVGANRQTDSPGRARSATYIAKGAVADVTRRFHPEQAQQVQPQPQT